MNEDIRFHIPQGFKLNYKSKDFFMIEYERTEMIAMNFFLGVWLLGWTTGCISLIFISYLDKEFIDFRFILIMSLVDVIALLCFLYSVFCKKSFQLNEKILVIKTKVLYYKTTKLFT